MDKTRKTEKDFYNEIKEALREREDVVAFCNKKLAQIEAKKNASSEKDQEKKAQREVDKQTILNALVEIGTYATLKEINACEGLTDFSNQKITNLLTEMLNVDKSVERKVEKRVAFYKAI